MEKLLRTLYREHFGREPERIEELSAHASERKIFRIFGEKQTYIGVINETVEENRAFIKFTKHFLKHELPVPEIYCVSTDEKAYIESDLGDDTLFHVIERARNSNAEPVKDIKALLIKVIKYLPQIQIRAAKDLDFSLCWPTDVFGDKEIRRDIEFFKKEFLARAGIEYSHSKFDKDVDILTQFLCEAEIEYFMFRDFQSRNVMVKEGNPYFIDYQSGRRGPLQYDVVSFLYQSKARLPNSLREELLEAYLEEASTLCALNRTEFMKRYDAYVLIRIMQVLATYGKQGLGLGKSYFVESIPFCLDNLEAKLSTLSLPIKINSMLSVFSELVKLRPQFIGMK